MAPTPVVLVEDDAHYRRSVGRALEMSACYVLTQTFTSADACQRAVVDGDSIWLIDLGLPGTLTGLDLIRPVVNNGARVLVTTVFEDEARVVAAIEQGAHGYHVKGDGELVRSMDEVMAGHAPLSPKIATHLLRRMRDRDGAQSLTPLKGQLSPREMETLQALAHGYSYREIAERHRVSYHTVGDHVKSIYKKLQVTSKTAAINTALKQGILSLDEV